jgi:hypothetical protein
METYETISEIMRVFLTYSEGSAQGIVRETVNAKITDFKMNTSAAWKLVVSDESKKLKTGKPEILNIQKIKLPRKALAKPLSILRHPSAVIVGLMECEKPSLVEEEKCIERVILYPVKDFEVESGDLIGVFEVQFVETGLLKGVKSREISGIGEVREANMVFDDDGTIHRRKITAPGFEYRMSPCAYWIPIVSRERRDVQRGKVTRLRIREISLPPNTIVKPLCGLSHALGVIIEVVGDVKLVEEVRRVREVIFVPLGDGVIEDGDLLGALDVHYISTKEKVVQFQESEFQKVKISYTDDGEVKRKETIANAVGYMRTFSGYWIPIVSEEDVDVRAGEITTIKVRDIFIPEYTVVSPIHVPNHATGCILNIKTEMPKKIEERKSVSEVIFLPVLDEKIEKNDLLGSLSVHNIYFTWDLLLFPPKPPEARVEELRRKIHIFTE